jgi:hypothetical protein
MKKLFTIAILGLLSTGAFAQTSQGTKVVSGSIHFRSYTEDDKEQGNYISDYSSLYFSFASGVGYFLKDNLQVGLSAGYNYQKVENIHDNEFSDYTSTDKNNTYSLSPYLKKYFPLSEKVALSTMLSAGLDIGRRKYETESHYPSTSESRSSGYFANLTPGVTFFPSERIGMSASFGNLGYYHSTSKVENNDSKIIRKSKTFDLDLSSSTFGIGFGYYF